MGLIEEASKGAKLLLDHAYVRILAREDADAVCAAALLGHALRREGVDFHVSWLPRLTVEAAQAITAERAEASVFIGLSGDASEPGTAGGKRVVLDRAPATLQGEAILDPRHAQEQDAAASLSSLAFLLGVAMSKRNTDLSPIALAGGSAAAVHSGALRGLDAEIRAEAEETGHVVIEPALALSGETLLTALATLDAPFVSGVTGRARNARKLAQDLQLSPDAPPSGLAPAASERLGGILALRLLQQQAPDTAIEALTRRHVRAVQGPATGLEAGEVASLAEAAVAMGRPSLAFAAAWPDATLASELAETRRAFREEIVAALLRAERERRIEGPLVVADAPRAGFARAIADRVALAFAPKGRVAVARASSDGHVELAFRAFDGPHVGKALRHTSAATGAPTTGSRSEGRAVVDAADEGRFLKSVAEGLG